MSTRLINVMGDPVANRQAFERNNMILWDVPQDINDAIKALPNKIYCNKRVVAPLEAAFRAVIAEGVQGEIKTWDGCFNVRKMRGKNILSMHSFGIAIDMNAAWNPLIKVGVLDREILKKQYVQWSEKFLNCWRSNGWTCGADWKTILDGMHFEYTKI
jgi:hypothetical protein